MGFQQKTFLELEAEYFEARRRLHAAERYNHDEVSLMRLRFHNARAELLDYFYVELLREENPEENGALIPNPQPRIPNPAEARDA
jgi:hypothetical protein